MQTIIPVNTKASGVIDTSLSTAALLYTPTTMTGTAFTFLASQSATGTFGRVGDGAGNAYSVTYTAGDVVPLDPAIMATIPFLIVVSGSTETGSDKIIGVGLIPR